MDAGSELAMRNKDWYYEVRTPDQGSGWHVLGFDERCDECGYEPDTDAKDLIFARAHQRNCCPKGSYIVKVTAELMPEVRAQSRKKRGPSSLYK